MKQDIKRPACPECRHPMSKFGTVWSGRTKRQRWQCPNCGRIIVGDTVEEKGGKK